jgi:hypothetical protein
VFGFWKKLKKREKGAISRCRSWTAYFCHDGELHSQSLEPRRGKTFQDFEKMEMDQKASDPSMDVIPDDP